MRYALLTALCFLAACAPSQHKIEYAMAKIWHVQSTTCLLSFNTLNLSNDSTYTTNDGQSGNYSIVDEKIEFEGVVVPLSLIDLNTLKLGQGTCEAILTKESL